MQMQRQAPTRATTRISEPTRLRSELDRRCGARSEDWISEMSQAIRERTAGGGGWGGGKRSTGITNRWCNLGRLWGELAHRDAYIKPETADGVQGAGRLQNRPLRQGWVMIGPHFGPDEL